MGPHSLDRAGGESSRRPAQLDGGAGTADDAGRAMDGVHDLGGCTDSGRWIARPTSPSFHAPWEAAVYAIMRASMSNGLYNLDEFRHGVERMDPAHYLRSGYYEHWLDGIARVLVEKGVVSAEELERRTEFFAARPDAPVTAAVGAMPANPAPASTGARSLRSGRPRPPALRAR